MKTSEMSQEQRNVLVDLMFDEIEKIIKKFKSKKIFEDEYKQNFFEIQLFAEKIDQIRKLKTFDMDDIKRLAGFYNFELLIYNNLYGRFRKSFYQFLDEIKKEAKKISTLYKRSRQSEGCKKKPIKFNLELRKKLEVEFNRTPNVYSSHYSKKESKVILTSWEEKLFSATKNYQATSDLEELDTILISFPEWLKIYSDYYKQNDKNFIKILEEFIQFLNTYTSKMIEISSEAINKVVMPDRAQLEKEAKEKYGENIDELSEIAAIKIPKKGDKAELKILRKQKKEANEELKKLKTQVENYVNQAIRKVENNLDAYKSLQKRLNSLDVFLKKIAKLFIGNLYGFVNVTSSFWNEPDPDDYSCNDKAKKIVNKFTRNYIQTL